MRILLALAMLAGSIVGVFTQRSAGTPAAAAPVEPPLFI